MRMRTVALAALAAAGLIGVANAAEPSEGTISNSSPKVEWGGTLASSGITNNIWAEDPTFECNPPMCDTFALKVADAGTVTVTLNMLSTNADGSDPGCGIRIIKPDDSAEWFDGTCSEETTMKAVLKNAPAGDYTVDVASSHICCGTEDYKAAAFLPAGAAAPAPGATPAPAPSAAPTPAPAVKLTAKVPTLSAKKLKKTKKFAATLNSSAPLSNVNGVLVNRSRKLGSGKLASLNGTAKLTVRVEGRIKPGTYTLSVGGRDAQGRNVVTTAKVKVGR